MSKIDRNVALPEVTLNAYVAFTFSDLEKVQEYFGDKWYAIVMDGIDCYRIVVMRKLLEIGLHEATPEQVFAALDPETICGRLLDALMRMIKGKTLAQLAGAR